MSTCTSAEPVYRQAASESSTEGRTDADVYACADAADGTDFAVRDYRKPRDFGWAASDFAAGVYVNGSALHQIQPENFRRKRERAGGTWNEFDFGGCES